MTLDELRRQLDQLDRQLLQIIAERQADQPRDRARQARHRLPDPRLRRERDVHPRRAQPCADARRLARYRRRR